MPKDFMEKIDDAITDTQMDVIVKEPSRRIYRLWNETGEGMISMYEVMPGIFLMFNDFHMPSCYSRFDSQEVLLAIDHCRQGVIEMENDFGCYCLHPGEMRIDRRLHHQGEVRFPLSHYHGVTVGFQYGLAQESLKKEFPGMELDLENLAGKFCPEKDSYILRSDPSIENLFTQLYQLPQQCRNDYFKVKILELLVYMKSVDFLGEKIDRPCFFRGTVEKIHAIEELITSHPEQHFTQEELADRFEISLTAMKTCFREIYGLPIYEYLRQYRLSMAGERLLTDRDAKISEIAGEFGYTSQSKFGQAFKAYFHQSPAEYRRTNGRRKE